MKNQTPPTGNDGNGVPQTPQSGTPAAKEAARKAFTEMRRDPQRPPEAEIVVSLLCAAHDAQVVHDDWAAFRAVIQVDAIIAKIKDTYWRGRLGAAFALIAPCCSECRRLRPLVVWDDEKADYVHPPLCYDCDHAARAFGRLTR